MTNSQSDMEIEELEKKLRHLEFTSSQEISRLNTLLESEKQRADLLEKSLKSIGSLQNSGNQSGSEEITKLKEENSLLLAQKQEAENKLKQAEDLVMEALKEKDAHIESLQEHASTMKAVYKKQMEFCSEELKRLEAENLELQNKLAMGGGGGSDEALLQKLTELEEHNRLVVEEKMRIDEQFQNLLAKYEEQTGNYEAELNQLRAEIEERITERDRLYEQLSGTKDVKHELISEIEKAEERLRMTEKTHAEQIREIERREKALQAELREAQKTIKEKTALCEENMAALAKSKETERELHAIKDALAVKVKQLEEQVKRLDAAKESEVVRACNLETDQKKKEAEIKTLKEKLKKYDDQLKELHGLLAASEERERALAVQVNELEMIKRKEKDEHESQIAVLNSEKMKLIAMINAAKKEEGKEEKEPIDTTIEFRARSTTLNDNVNPITGEANALAHELEEAYNLTQGSTAESEKIERLEGELKALQSELKQMKDSQTDTEGEKVKELMGEHNKKVVTLMTELDLLKAENIKLNADIKCLEMKKKTEVQYLENELAIMNKAMANTKVMLAQITCEKEMVETQYRQLVKRMGGK